LRGLVGASGRRLIENIPKRYLLKMVKSEYAEEEILMSGKTSCNEEEDEDMAGDWPQDPNSVSTEERSPLRGNSENGSTGSGVGNEAEMTTVHGGTSSGNIEGSLPRNGSTTPLDDRRIRRQIANCNERRRMQSINAGFQALRSLLPRKDGEKMSKAAILQHTAEYIQCLQDEKNRLADENNSISAQSKKRRIANGEYVDTVDDGSIAKSNQSTSADVMEYLRTIDDLKLALSKEHRLRVIYEREVIEMRTKSMQDTASLGVLRAAAGVTSLLTPQSLNFEQTLTRSDPSLLIAGPHTPQLHTPSTPADTLLLAASQQVYNNVLLNAAAAAVATSPQSLSTVTSTQISPHHQNVTTNPSSPFHQPQIRSTIGDLVSTSSGISSPACIMDNNSSVLNSISGKTTTIQSQDQGNNSNQFSQRNLQAIIEAIRHIEGGNMASRVAATSSPSPHSADLLVR